MFISDLVCFMVSMGHGDPAMIPVVRLLMSYWLKLGWFSISMNMVGVPYCDVILGRRKTFY